MLTGVEEEDAGETSAELAAGDRGSGVAAATRVRYVTVPIEQLVARGGGEMGDGGGQFVLARDQHDPGGPLVRRRIGRTYERTAHHLRVVSIRDGEGREQTIRVTDEHPFFVAGRGWTKAQDLSAGDRLAGAAGEASTVLSNLGEEHPEGVTVYNLEVEDDHTYFVRGEGSDGEPVWVHNANYQDGVTGTGKLSGAGNDKLRATALRQAGATSVHESVPVYGTRGKATTGTLSSDLGDAYLISGRGPGRQLSLLDDLVIQDHVEMHGAALMDLHGIEEATLYLNRVPCSGGLGCSDVLAYALPDGARLHVVSPVGRVTYYGGGF